VVCPRRKVQGLSLIIVTFTLTCVLLTALLVPRRCLGLCAPAPLVPGGNVAPELARGALIGDCAVIPVVERQLVTRLYAPPCKDAYAVVAFDIEDLYLTIRVGRVVYVLRVVTFRSLALRSIFLIQSLSTILFFYLCWQLFGSSREF